MVILMKNNTGNVFFNSEYLHNDTRGLIFPSVIKVLMVWGYSTQVKDSFPDINTALTSRGITSGDKAEALRLM